MRRWAKRLEGREEEWSNDTLTFEPETNESIKIKLFICLFAVKVEGWQENGRKTESNKDVPMGGRWTAAQVQSTHSNLGKCLWMQCNLQLICPPKDSSFVPWRHKRLTHSENLFVSDALIQQILSQSSSCHTSYLEKRWFWSPEKNEMIRNTHLNWK